MDDRHQNIIRLVKVNPTRIKRTYVLYTLKKQLGEDSR